LPPKRGNAMKLQGRQFMHLAGGRCRSPSGMCEAHSKMPKASRAF
jgi:hypothetical protein